MKAAAFSIPAANHDKRIGRVASIHPYRDDTAEEVAVVVKQGALAVKWLPPAMGIDPASKLCNRLKRHVQIDGVKFGRETFETARVFRRAV